MTASKDTADLVLVVNALSARTGGGLTYVTSVVAALAPLLKDHETILVRSAPWNHKSLSVLDGPQVRVEMTELRGVVDRVRFEQTKLPKLHPDAVFYSPGNFVSFRASTRTILVVQHSAYFEGEDITSGSALKKLRFSIERAMCRRSVRRAALVVAISATLRELIVTQLPTASEKTLLIYSGRPDLPTPSLPPSAVPDGASFGLMLSPDLPHKNLDLALDGWSRSSAASHGRLLIIAGAVTSERAQELRGRLPVSLQDLCKFLGQVDSRAHVAWLLENADYMLSVSSVESFGLPSVEAASVGCPVVLSDIPAHREISGEWAHFVRPDDPASIASQIDAATNSEHRRYDWPQTWHDHALELIDVVRGLHDQLGAGER